MKRLLAQLALCTPRSFKVPGSVPTLTQSVHKKHSLAKLHSGIDLPEADGGVVVSLVSCSKGVGFLCCLAATYPGPL